MKKILLLLTGGTIGSRAEGNCIDVTGRSPLLLLELYRQSYGEEESFEVARPFTILSENMRTEQWSLLARQLWDAGLENYSGVIIAHGSDTLSYTCALMGMLFSHTPIPIVFTASNYPPGERGSNGLANLRGAVELIRTPGIRGVFAVYRSREGRMQVHLATRITEADPYLDEFGGFGGSVLGEIRDQKLQLYDNRINPSWEELCGEREALTKVCPVFKNSVLLIRPYPGFNYEGVDLEAGPAAVVHYLYHSATACTQGEKESVLAFLVRCEEKAIPVYTASCKRIGGRAYATARDIMEQKAVPLANISPEAAYGKILLIHNAAEGEKALNRNLFFEHLPEPPDPM